MADKGYIEFAKVKKSFGEKVIYDDLTLSIQRGESLTIVGGSGTGKSVLLKILIGLLPADSGSIRLDGSELVGLTEEKLFDVRKRISMMFQGAALFDSLTVGENVAYPLREQMDLSAADVAARVAEKLALVDLTGSEDLLPSALSGGMKKRVALARAIVAEPECTLFDEPTAGLDPINTRRVDDLIRSIQRKQNMTVITVTHDLPSAYRISDRIAMLNERRIIAVLSTDEFRSTPIKEIHDFVSAMDGEPEEEKTKER